MAYCGATLGQCADLPTNCESTENVVCGCDHVNYWNDCLREQSGVGASTPGECTAAATCGGLAGLECPTDEAVCTYLHETQAHCAIMDPGGVCWVVPKTCPAVVIGGTLRSCGSPTTGPCLDRCRAINEGGSFFDDSTCPV